MFVSARVGSSRFPETRRAATETGQGDGGWILGPLGFGLAGPRRRERTF